MSFYTLMETLKPFLCTSCMKRYSTFDTYKTHCRSHGKQQKFFKGFTGRWTTNICRMPDTAGESNRLGNKENNIRERKTRRTSKKKQELCDSVLGTAVKSSKNKKIVKDMRHAGTRWKQDTQQLEDDIVEIPFDSLDSLVASVRRVRNGATQHKQKTRVRNGLPNQNGCESSVQLELHDSGLETAVKSSKSKKMVKDRRHTDTRWKKDKQQQQDDIVEIPFDSPDSLVASVQRVRNGTTKRKQKTGARNGLPNQNGWERIFQLEFHGSGQETTVQSSKSKKMRKGKRHTELIRQKTDKQQSEDDIVEIPFDSPDPVVTSVGTARNGATKHKQKTVVIKTGLSNQNGPTNSDKKDEDTGSHCSICDKTFRFPCIRRNHFKDVHSGIYHKCEVCSKEFKTERSLQMHKRLHADTLTHRCTICLKSFNQIGQLKFHMTNHTGEKKFVCQYCGKRFSRKTSWITHELGTHNPSSVKIKQLDIAKRYGANVKVLSCKVCNKTFTEKAHLSLHENGHYGVKPHKCQACGKSFSHKSNLTEHARIHNGVKPYKCEYCAETFRFQNNLKVHLRIHEEIRPYKCEYCQKEFRQTGNYTTHIRTHTGEKPYQCTDCDYRAAQSTTLAAHRNTHHSVPTAAKPYQCNECRHLFRTKYGLKKHKVTHTDEHRCDLCKLGFISDAHLLRHYKESQKHIKKKQLLNKAKKSK